MASYKNNNKKNNSYNVIAINAIANRFGFTPHYIRQCIRGERG